MINNTWSSESSSRYSGGQMSGLVDKPWPNFTKVGPNRVKILLSSAARFLLFWSSTPFRWSINSFRENEPKATNICRVLRNNWINIIINQLIRNKKKIFFFFYEKVKRYYWCSDNLNRPWTVIAGKKLGAVYGGICSTCHGSCLRLKVVRSVPNQNFLHGTGAGAFP